MFKIFLVDSRSLKGDKEVKGHIFKMFRLSWNYKQWSLWNSFETIKGSQRRQRLSLNMLQLSWKLLEMIHTIFWTCERYLEIDSKALRGPIGRLFSFLWLYNQPFYMPPNLPRALRKGAVSSGIFALTRFLTICFFFYKLTRILTKLGQNLQLVSSYKSYQQFDPKRYVGVTGVKSILKIQFYWKCFFSFILHSRVTWFMHIIKLKTLYKTYCLIFLNGVFWGH